MSTSPRVSVVGLGKLGSCLAACLAEKGFDVVGIDRDPTVIQAIAAGEAPVVEPGLADLIHRNRERITASTDIALAMRESDVTFIVVPTPSLPDGSFSVDLVIAAAEQLARAYTKDTYHVFVIVSTVLAGDMDRFVVPAFERASRRRVGRDFGICYSPEFIALGNVIAGILRPELQLIGESDARAGDLLTAIYARLNESTPTIVRTNYVNAEVAKIGLNAFVTMKITFANIVGMICETLPGGDADVVTRALGADARIGARYLRAGLGFGGPCFPRDDVAFGVVARAAGASSSIQDATHAINESIPPRIVRLVKGHLAPGGHVAVIGLAYKTDTPVVEASQSLDIARLLGAAGYRLTVCDPLALAAARAVLGEGPRFVTELDDAFADADLVVLGTDLKALRTYTPPRRARPLTVIDCWRIAEHLDGHDGVRYVGIGRGGAPD